MFHETRGFVEVGRHMRYPRKALRDINAYVHSRFIQHLRRRSQRGWQLPTEETTYAYFAQLGLIRL